MAPLYFVLCIISLVPAGCSYSWQYCEDDFCMDKRLTVSYELEMPIEGTNLTTLEYEYFRITGKSAIKSCGGQSLSVKVQYLKKRNIL